MAFGDEKKRVALLDMKFGLVGKQLREICKMTDTNKTATASPLRVSSSAMDSKRQTPQKKEKKEKKRTPYRDRRCGDQ